MASYPDQKNLPAYQQEAPIQQQPQDGTYSPQPIQQYPPQSPPPQMAYGQPPHDPNTAYQQQPVQQAQFAQQQQPTEKGAMQNMQQVPQQQQPGRQFQNATPLASLGRTPAPADCPACGQRSMTRISYVVGNYTHVWALVGCLVTWVCCWVPYLIDGTKNVDHHCGQCGTLLATWHRSGSTEVHQHS